jgi:hypothetical protein
MLLTRRRTRRGAGKKLFFSEEKNQKTFVFKAFPAAGAGLD